MFNPRQSSSPIFLVKIFIAWCLSRTEAMWRVPCTIAVHLKPFAHHCWCDERGLPHVAKTSLLWMTEAELREANLVTLKYATLPKGRVILCILLFLSEQHDNRSLHITLLLRSYFSEWPWQPPDLPPSTSSRLLRAFPSLAPMDRHPSHRCASQLRKCFLSKNTNILPPKKRHS